MADTEADDFVAGSEPDEDLHGSASPLPLHGLKILFSPSRVIQCSNVTDNMSPEIPKLVHTSTLGNNARRSVINQREKFTKQREDRVEESMFTDSDSCASEVIVPLNHSLLYSGTQPETLNRTLQASEMQEDPLAGQNNEEPSRAPKYSGSETTIGANCKENNSRRPKTNRLVSPKTRSQNADEGLDCGKSINSDEGSSGLSSKKQRRFSQRVLDKGNQSQESIQQNSLSQTPKGQTRKTRSSPRDDGSETTIEHCREDGVEKKAWSPSTLIQKAAVVPESDCGGSIQSDGGLSKSSSKKQRTPGQRISQRIMNRSSPQNSHESMEKDTTNVVSKGMTKKGSFVESQELTSTPTSIGKKNQDLNNKRVPDNVSVASSPNSHFSDETVDPTATQRMTQQLPNRNRKSIPKTVENSPIPSQRKVETDSCVEISQSQSLIEPAKSDQGMRGFGISSSQSSGSSGNSDAKVKAKEEKFRVHHDLELELIQKVEKHQATAKDVLGRKSLSSTGKVQSLLVSLAPLMEQLKKAHCHERQHIAREKEKNLNQAEQSLLKLQITLFVERARRLVTVYQQHTELTRMVKELRNEAQQKTFAAQNDSEVGDSQKKELPIQKNENEKSLGTKKKLADQVQSREQLMEKQSLESQGSNKKRPNENQIQGDPAKKKCTPTEKEASTNKSKGPVFTPPPVRVLNSTNKDMGEVEKSESWDVLLQHKTKPARSEISDDNLSLELCGRTINSGGEPGDNSDGAQEDDASMDFVFSEGKDNLSYAASTVADEMKKNPDIVANPRANDKEHGKRHLAHCKTSELQKIMQTQKDPRTQGLTEVHKQATYHAKGQDVTGSTIQRAQVIDLTVSREQERTSVLGTAGSFNTIQRDIQRNNRVVIQSSMTATSVARGGQPTQVVTSKAIQSGHTHVHQASDLSSLHISSTVKSATAGRYEPGLQNVNNSKTEKTPGRIYNFSSPTVGIKGKTADNMSFGSPYSSVYGSTICPTQTSLKRTSGIMPTQCQYVQQNRPIEVPSEDPIVIHLPKNKAVPKQNVIYLTTNQTSFASNQQIIGAARMISSAQVRPVGMQSSAGQGRANSVTITNGSSSSQLKTSHTQGKGPSLLQSVIVGNKAPVSRETVQQKKQVPSQLPGLPDLSELLAAQVIQPGNRVLTLESKNRVFNASLLHSGWIRGEGGEMFRTPMAWFKAVIPEAQKLVVTKKMTYPKVQYKGVPLSEFELSAPATRGSGTERLPPVGPGQTQHLAETGSRTITTGAAPVCEQLPQRSLLCRLLTRCRVAIHSDEQLVRNKGWLPDNFWTEPDFSKVDLPHSLVAEIDCW